MGAKTLSAVAAVGSMLLLGSQAEADLVGIEGVVTTVELRDSGNPFLPGPTSFYDSWRIYAVYDDPNDTLTAVAGNTASANPIHFSTSIGTFYNSAFAADDNDIATPALNAPEEIYDSWLDIGRTSADVGLIPFRTFGFPVLGNGLSDYIVVNGAYARTPDDTLTIAGADLRVVFAQLTVPAGARLDGLVRLNGDTSATPNGGTIDNITFSFQTPAPGVLGVLVLAGLVGSRRRRPGPLRFRER